MKKSIIVTAGLLLLGTASTFTFTSCSSTSTGKSTGEYIDDAAITAKVKAAFVQDPVVKAIDVGVDTYKGVVQLNGFVENPEQASRAEQVARNISGVTGVENKLSIKGQQQQQYQQQYPQQQQPMR